MRAEPKTGLNPAEVSITDFCGLRLPLKDIAKAEPFRAEPKTGLNPAEVLEAVRIQPQWWAELTLG